MNRADNTAPGWRRGYAGRSRYVFSLPFTPTFGPSSLSIFLASQTLWPHDTWLQPTGEGGPTAILQISTALNRDIVLARTTIDFAGKDATEAFEDVGHSDEARAMLTKMYLGEFKGEVGFFCLPFYPYSHPPSLPHLYPFSNFPRHPRVPPHPLRRSVGQSRTPCVAERGWRHIANG